MRPKTYAEAVEELGGRPWQRLEGTEQWFLQEEAPAQAKVTRELDTDAFRIPKRRLPLLARMGLWWLGFAAGGAALVLFVSALAASARPTPQLPPRVQPLPVVVAAPPKPAVVAPPPVLAPPPKPVVAPPKKIVAKKTIRAKKHKNRYAKRP